MSPDPLRTPKSRRAALAGGAALVLTDPKDVVVFTSAAPIDLTQRRDDWLKAVAGKLGVSTDRLQQAMHDANKDVGLPPPLLTAPVIGSALPGTFGVRVMPPAARALGITEDQLRKEQASGKSLADVARAHNVDPKVVAEAMKAQRRSDMEKAVSDGVMPRETADKIRSHVDEEVDRLMQAVPAVGANGAVSVQFQFTPGLTP